MKKVKKGEFVEVKMQWVDQDNLAQDLSLLSLTRTTPSVSLSLWWGSWMNPSIITEHNIIMCAQFEPLEGFSYEVVDNNEEGRLIS